MKPPPPVIRSIKYEILMNRGIVEKDGSGWTEYGKKLKKILDNFNINNHNTTVEEFKKKFNIK